MDTADPVGRRTRAGAARRYLNMEDLLEEESICLCVRATSYCTALRWFTDIGTQAALLPSEADRADFLAERCGELCRTHIGQEWTNPAR